MSHYAQEKLCPCSSGKTYGECCHPYHEGIRRPVTPEALMRSRFSAYALNLTDFIIATTHKDHASCHTDSAEWASEIQEFSQTTSFERLEVINQTTNSDIAFVSFRAHLKRLGEDATFSERSRFLKEDGQWFYRDGKILGR